MDNLPSDEVLIFNMIKGVAPEREEELRDLWEKYKPALSIISQRPGATMNADAKRIEFDVKLIDVFWVLGYAAWQAVATYTPLVVLGPVYNVSLDELMRLDERFIRGERDFKETIAAARSFVEGAVDIDRWPGTIPQPDPDRNKFSNPIHQAIYDLVLMALAFTWLHEVKHVIFLQDGTNPPSRPDEELACDVWARGFVLDKLSEYAHRAGNNYHEVYSKRALAMSMAVMIIHMLTPEFSKFGDQNYPPIGERIQTIIGDTAHQEDSVFWTATACILIGLRRLSHAPLDIAAGSRKELVQKLIAQARE